MTASVTDRELAPDTRVDFARSITALLIAFFVVRPSLDNLATFDIGPNLNLPIGGLLLLTATVFVVHRAATEPSYVLPWTSLAALTLAAIALLSALGADQLMPSVATGTRLVTIALVFVACEELAFQRPKSAIPIAIAVGCGLILTAPIAIGQLAEWLPRPTDDSLGDTRVPGPFPAPTVFATCMMIVVALIIGLAPVWWRRQPNWIWVLGPVATGATYLLLVNASRSPLAALLLAVVLIAVVQRRWLLLVPFAVAGGALLLLDPSIAERPAEIFDQSDEEVVLGAETNTFAWRVRIWEESLVLRDERPLLGIGLGGVEERNGNVPPHSTTVQALVELGLAGLVAHYALVGALGIALAGAVRRTRDVTTNCLLSVAVGLCVGYFLMSFFENLLTQVVTSGPVAAITGLALGLARRAAAETQ